MTDLANMLAKAKEECKTMQRLAANAREYASQCAAESFKHKNPAISVGDLNVTAWYQLAHTYDSSIVRLTGIIRLAELQIEEQAKPTNKPNVCLKHRCYQPCITCWREEHSLKPKL